MRLVSGRHSGRDIVGILVGDVVRDLTGVLPDGDHSPMRRLLQKHGASLGELDDLDLPALPLDELVISAPVTDPSKIMAAPVNYTDHQKEMKQTGHVGALGLFLKAPSSIIGPGERVWLPYHDRRFDQEGELAVIIGRTLRDTSETEAMAGIAGFTCLLDITMRGGEDRSIRKSFDTFTPMGPHLVTPDEINDLGSVRLVCRVNGAPRQDAEIREMIWGVEKLVSYASSVMTLHPGDVLTTGTPAGVGEIGDGDEISVTIDGVGTLSVSVTASGAVTCPTSGATSGPVPPTSVTPVRARRADGGYDNAELAR